LLRVSYNALKIEAAINNKAIDDLLAEDFTGLNSFWLVSHAFVGDIFVLFEGALAWMRGANPFKIRFTCSHE
jgi:hypothetical protein